MPKMPSISMPDFSKVSMPSWPSFLTPSWPSIDVHKSTIIQGSVLEIEAVEQLQLGMSKTAVMELIGSPSISDPFHEDQWDYIHHSTIDGEEVIHYRLTLVFEGNLLSVIDDSGLGGLLNSAD
ncbi:MAG TPA: outer membrane protein assembly factor BamE [Candidatus Thioglobus sp.]|nr:outer membrane protein assembly factor BamE [Candidatus Thioglobus sp.]